MYECYIANVLNRFYDMVERSHFKQLFKQIFFGF